MGLEAFHVWTANESSDWLSWWAAIKCGTQTCKYCNGWAFPKVPHISFNPPPVSTSFSRNPSDVMMTTTATTIYLYGNSVWSVNWLGNRPPNWLSLWFWHENRFDSTLRNQMRSSCKKVRETTKEAAAAVPSSIPLLIRQKVRDDIDWYLPDPPLWWSLWTLCGCRVPFNQAEVIAMQFYSCYNSIHNIFIIIINWR